MGMGGAIYLENGIIMSVVSSHFEDNQAVQGGAVIALYSVKLSIVSTTFLNNLAAIQYGPGFPKSYADSTSVIGGAISSLFDNTLSIQSSCFISNEARGKGAALFLLSNSTSPGYLYINDSHFENNINNCIEVTAVIEVYINIICFMLNTLILNNNGGVIISGMNNVSMHVKNCSLIDNRALDTSGISVGNSMLEVEDTKFINNTSKDVGAIFAGSSYVIVRNSNFENNTGNEVSCLRLQKNATLIVLNTTFSKSSKIAIMVATSHAILKNCLITNSSHVPLNDNRPLVSITKNSDFQINNCSITSNKLYSFSFLEIERSKLSVKDTKIKNSIIESLIIAKESNISITTCIFENNLSVLGIGGTVIQSIESDIHLLDSIVQNNIASRSGGVLYIFSGNISIWNNTFISNRAGHFGGVICVNSIGYSSLYIVNTSFQYNQAGTKGDVIYTTTETHTEIKYIILDFCSITENIGQNGTALYLRGCLSLQMARCNITYHDSNNGTSIDINTLGFPFTFITYKVIISNAAFVIRSSDPNFLHKAASRDDVGSESNDMKMYINSTTEEFRHEETPYAAGMYTEWTFP